MPFYPAVGVAEFALHGTFSSSEEVVNVLHVRRKNDAVSTTWTQQALDQASSRVSGAWMELMNLLCNQYRVGEIRSKDLSAAVAAVSTFGTALQGSSTSAASPPSNNALIQWRTGMSGRGSNGRSYVTGIPEGQVDALGRLEVGYQADLTAAAGRLLTDLAKPTDSVWLGAPLELVVLHTRSGVETSRGATAVVFGRASNVIGTQRRRLPRRAS